MHMVTVLNRKPFLTSPATPRNPFIPPKAQESQVSERMKHNDMSKHTHTHTELLKGF